MEKTVANLEEFNTEAAGFAATLKPDSKVATLVTLSGELGAGKTAFTKAVAQAFGIQDIVNSPTFVLEKIYAIPEPHSFAKLIHIDAYRLEKGEDIAPLHLDKAMRESGNLIFIEWPERIVDALPKAARHLSFKVESGTARTISYE